MSLFIIGGDNLGKMRHKMKGMGFDNVRHLSGRKKNVCRNFQLSGEVDVILVLTDYINHNLMRKVKNEAYGKGVKLLFSKRNWSSISKKLEKVDIVN